MRRRPCDTTGSITEEFFGYDGAEYAAWTSNDLDLSRRTVALRLAQCGDLGKAETTYFNQATDGGHHFPANGYDYERAIHRAQGGDGADGR
jgi:hypothetical protein